MLLPKTTVLALTAILAASCATQQQTRDQATATQAAEARPTLAAALERCTDMHGYDPRTATEVPEHELAPNETAWRQCAYDALRANRGSDPEVRDQTELLIAQDIAMTAAVGQGTMTRAQRKRLNTEKFEEIMELQQARSRAAGNRTEQVIEGLRDFPL